MHNVTDVIQLLTDLQQVHNTFSPKIGVRHFKDAEFRLAKRILANHQDVYEKHEQIMRMAALKLAKGNEDLADEHFRYIKGL